MFDMTYLTLKEAISSARKVIDDFGPNYVYTPIAHNRCNYYHSVKNEPSCLVGHIFYRNGMGREVLTKLDCLAESFVGSEEFEEIISLRPKVSKFLSSLQEFQDEGVSWGTALEMALEGTK
jgi:hypothetical protein